MSFVSTCYEDVAMDQRKIIFCNDGQADFLRVYKLVHRYQSFSDLSGYSF